MPNGSNLDHFPNSASLHDLGQCSRCDRGMYWWCWNLKRPPGFGLPSHKNSQKSNAQRIDIWAVQWKNFQRATISGRCCGALPIVADKDDYLADVLVDLGFITAEQLAKAREEANASNVGVVDLLLASKTVKPADVVQAKAAQFGAEVIHLGSMKIPDDVISIIPRHLAKKYRVIPVFKDEGKIAVATSDPSDLNTIDTLTHLLHAEIELRVASEQDIEAALNKYYGGATATTGKTNAEIEAAIIDATESEVAIAGPT